MAGFIEELKEEHRVILHHFENIQRMGVHTMEGRNELTDARDYLLAHLEKEDTRLYPALRLMAPKHPSLKEILDIQFPTRLPVYVQFRRL